MKIVDNLLSRFEKAEVFSMSILIIYLILVIVILWFFHGDHKKW